MQGMLKDVLNAIEDARKAEGKCFNVGNLKYTIRYKEEAYYLLIDESDVVSYANGSLLYISKIAESFLILIK